MTAATVFNGTPPVVAAVALIATESAVFGFLVVLQIIWRHRPGKSRWNLAWEKDPVSGPLVICLKPHRFSLRVNEWYLVLLEAPSVKYRGMTMVSIKSGLMMTKLLPLLRKIVTRKSEKIGVFKIYISNESNPQPNRIRFNQRDSYRTLATN